MSQDEHSANGTPASSQSEATEREPADQGRTDREAPDADTATDTARGGAAATDASGGDASSGDAGERDVKDVLADVAAGRIDPAQAAQLLDQAAKRTSAATADAAATAQPVSAEPGTAQRETTTDPVPRATDQAGVTRVRIRALGRRVKIIGEPFVKTVAIDGPHVIKHEDDTLVITSEGELGASLDGFTLLQTRSLRDVQERVLGLGRELSIRVNPALAIEAEVTAGGLTAERLPGLEQVRVTAGSARVRDVNGPFDLLVQAGSAYVEGTFTTGHTRLRGESGSIQVYPLPGSDVRIRHDVQLGRIVWEPDGGEKKERVLGAGTATLDLEVVMGQVTVQEAP